MTNTFLSKIHTIPSLLTFVNESIGDNTVDIQPLTRLLKQFYEIRYSARHLTQTKEEKIMQV